MVYHYPVYSAFNIHLQHFTFIFEDIFFKPLYPLAQGRPFEMAWILRIVTRGFLPYCFTDIFRDIHYSGWTYRILSATFNKL